MILYDVLNELDNGKFKSKQFGAIIFRFSGLPETHHIVAIKLADTIYDEFFLYSSSSGKIERDWRPSAHASKGDSFELEFNDDSLDSYRVIKKMIKLVISFIMNKENPKFSKELITTKYKPKHIDTPIQTPAKQSKLIDIENENNLDINEISIDAVITSTPNKAVELSNDIEIDNSDYNVNNEPRKLKATAKVKHSDAYLKRVNRKQKRKNPADGTYSIPFTGCIFSFGRGNIIKYDVDGPYNPFKILAKIVIDGKLIRLRQKNYPLNDVGLIEAAFTLQKTRIRFGLLSQLELLPEDYEFIQKTNAATFVNAINFNSKIPYEEYKDLAISKQNGIPKHSEIAKSNISPRKSDPAIPLDQVDKDLLDSIINIPSEARAHYYHYMSPEYIAVYGKRLPTKEEKAIKSANKRNKKTTEATEATEITETTKSTETEVNYNTQNEIISIHDMFKNADSRIIAFNEKYNMRLINKSNAHTTGIYGISFYSALVSDSLKYNSNKNVLDTDPEYRVYNDPDKINPSALGFRCTLKNKDQNNPDASKNINTPKAPPNDFGVLVTIFNEHLMKREMPTLIFRPFIPDNIINWVEKFGVDQFIEYTEYDSGCSIEHTLLVVNEILESCISINIDHPTIIKLMTHKTIDMRSETPSGKLQTTKVWPKPTDTDVDQLLTFDFSFLRPLFKTDQYYLHFINNLKHKYNVTYH